MALLKPLTASTALLYRGISSTAAVSQKYRMPDMLEHATGRTRIEILNRLAGDDDVYLMKPATTKGKDRYNKDDPIIIKSRYPVRKIQCSCNDEFMHLKYMFVAKGHPRRCECGYWFKLEIAPPLLVDDQVFMYLENTRKI